ncbi:MAG: lysophospholipid acyltransferase family protein [Acholeplasmataceae bacterium]|jgi:1-acyl-sn-glycerol-3-phosphate acyltransferase|nr:lysophospholipid acyltransferase family protein [Acholeplasmataceae bacterium]
MISAIYLILWAVYTILMSLFVLSGYWIILWFFTGAVVSFFGTLLIILAHFPFLKYSKVTNPYKYYVTRSTAHWLTIFFMRLKVVVEGRENIPKDGPLCIYANHKSYADPFVIFEFMKRPTTFTPKMSVYKAIFIGKWLKYLGAFPIDRSSDRNTARAMIDAIKVIKEGMAMTIFPEGGIKDRNDEKMVAMRAGAYRVAMKAGANLLPVSIQGTTAIKHRAPWRISTIQVVIHPVVLYETIKEKTTLEVADMMFHIINNKLTTDKAL